MRMNSKILLLFIIIILIKQNKTELQFKQQESSKNDAEKSYQEQLLIENLFVNYNKRIKPLGTVQIKFSLQLNQIVNVIEKDQIVLINVFMDHEWIDNRIVWDPCEYGNITLLRISSDQLWTPDTFIYTTADQTGFILPQAGTYFLVQNSGTIFWPNPKPEMKIRCRMSIKWFPFDEQLCTIVFGSWSHTSNNLNYTIINENPTMYYYTENNEWALIDYKPFRSELKYETWIENETFSEIKYKILIRRKSLFVLQNYVVPVQMLCILTLLSFFIPFAQQMQIGISILLSFAVFKLRLSDDVPVQSDTIPLINIYFTLCIFFSLTSMIWFSIYNNLKEKNNLRKSIRNFVLKYISITKFNRKTTNHIKINKNHPIDTNEIMINFELNNISENESSINKIDTKNSIWVLRNSIDESDDSEHIRCRNLLNEYQRNNKETPLLISELNNKTGMPKSKVIEPIDLVDGKHDTSFYDEATTTTATCPDKADEHLTDLNLIRILNKIMFFLFFVFIFIHNLVCLLIFPYFIRDSLLIEN